MKIYGRVTLLSLLTPVHFIAPIDGGGEVLRSAIKSRPRTWRGAGWRGMSMWVKAGGLSRICRK